ncbi:MAG: cob(I)yrinic acid a,c-diamide adenosyltransferase [Bacteroidales bacterium]|nr:cob(I)yrinic acid a,c-diamide adenosyltransferase [Bacteroidales bacterium]
MKNKKSLKQYNNIYYSRKGDQGYTCLISGEKVAKSDTRIMAYGSVDELIAFVSLLYNNIQNNEIKEHLLFIMNKLMNVACQLASNNDKLAKKLPDIKKEDVEKLENFINLLTKELPLLKDFILPIGSTLISYAHICRTVCRRCETIIVKLTHEKSVDPHILSFINRLSSYFFILARYLAYMHNIKETTWSK